MCLAVKMFGPSNNADVQEMAQASETSLTLADSKRIADSCLQRNTCGTLTESSMGNKGALGFVKPLNENP